MSSDVLYYDDRCRWCRLAARLLAGALARRGVLPAPLWRGWSMQRLGLEPGQTPPPAPVLESDGHVLAGRDAMSALAKRIWWLRVWRATGASLVLRRLHRHHHPPARAPRAATRAR